MDELLLTDEECWKFGFNKGQIKEALEAQLARADPLIRKDERAKLFAQGNEDCPHTLVGHMTKRHCLLCWQVMLGEE